jgi:hypothetical protein
VLFTLRGRRPETSVRTTAGSWRTMRERFTNLGFSTHLRAQERAASGKATRAPRADEQGNVYVSTGNGLFDAATTTGGADYGDSLLKLRLQGDRLVLSNFFTPNNQSS